MDSMRRAVSWLAVLGGALLPLAGAANPPSVNITSVTPAPPAPLPAGAEDDPAIRPLLEKLTTLSEAISRDGQSVGAWRYHQEQGEILLELAEHAPEAEREALLRLAVESYYSAAVLSPENESTAYEKLTELAKTILRDSPASRVAAYATLQEIQAEYMRALAAAGDNSTKAKEHLCERLLRFAQDYPSAPEAPKAVLDAAQASEALGQEDNACRYYRYLEEHFHGHALARKAVGALWRLRGTGERVHLELPLLFGDEREPPFNLDDLRGNLVVVYFWASTCASAAEDFRALKQLTDRYQYRRVQVVYVNLDPDPAQGRAFLAERLTAGVHVFQRGGLEGPVAERYGIHDVPQAFLVGPGGALVRHSLQASQLEAEVAKILPHSR
jgi:hypothetical protein